MNLKNKLKTQANKVLSTQQATSSSSMKTTLSAIDKITREIKANLQELNEIKEFFIVKRQQAALIREKIIQTLLYVRDHKKELLKESFEEYLETQIGLTKGYFYEQVQAYELCQKYGVPEYFSEIDYKILVYIARVKDKEYQKLLIYKAPSLTRETLKYITLDNIKNHDLVFEKKKANFSISEKASEISLVFEKPLTESEKAEIVAFLSKKFQISL
jgi:hypothetical protein